MEFWKQKLNLKYLYNLHVQYIIVTHVLSSRSNVRTKNLITQNLIYQMIDQIG
jgi:hypothetical protein